MPEVTSHAPGAPSWSELSTTDEAGALSFYSTLFGWEDDPQEMGPNWFYHLQKINDLPPAPSMSRTKKNGARVCRPTGTFTSP